MVKTVPVGKFPYAVGIVPPPPGVPFLAFSATLAIDIDAPKQDAFNFQSNMTLSSTAPGINPPVDAVTVRVGTFATTIPPGSFKGKGYGPFYFLGAINGVTLEALMTPTGPSDTRCLRRRRRPISPGPRAR